MAKHPSYALAGFFVATFLAVLLMVPASASATETASLGQVLSAATPAKVLVQTDTSAGGLEAMADTFEVRLSSNQTLTIEDGDSGRLRVTLADISTQVAATKTIVVKSVSSGAELSGTHIVSKATSSPVNLALSGINIKTSGGSPVSVLSGTLNISLVGDNVVHALGETYLINAYPKNAGVYVEGGAKLVIGGTGSLEATGGYANPGIGSDKDPGTVVITSGKVRAIGGKEFHLSGSGAGIGGAANCPGINLTITGGTVYADSDTQDCYAAGIGGGGASQNGSVSLPKKGGTTTITGGTVTAKGASAGIGSAMAFWGPGNDGPSDMGGVTTISGGSVTAIGYQGAGIGGGTACSGGKVTITGGKVTAKGGLSAAGIGSGQAGTEAGTVTISGGSVTATGGSGGATDSGSGAGIGAGCGGYFGGGNGGVVTISGGTVMATGGKGASGIGAGCSGLMYGGNGGTVTITGGVVTAVGGSGGAGIGGGLRGFTGGGQGGDVSIAGGTVVARSGGNGGLGIGCGGPDYLAEIYHGTCTITGGSVLATGSGTSSDVESMGPTPTGVGGGTVYRYVVSLKGVADGTNMYGATLTDSEGFPITYYGTKDMYTTNSSLHGGNGTLYLYLPHNSGSTTDLGRVVKADDGTYARTADVNLYAKANYTVTFDGNGATSGSMGTESFAYGEEKALTANAYERTGYRFVGWSTRSDAVVATYSDGQVTSNVVGQDASKTSVTLYAVWWHKPSYLITYKSQSPTAGSVTRARELVTSGATGQGSTAVPNEGYSFDCWYCQYPQRWASDAVTFRPTDVDGMMTYLALFKGNTYTVVFDANRGTGTMAPQAMTYGSPVALTANTFTRPGYRFLGWSTDKGATAATYADAQRVSNLTPTAGGTVTLYAVWGEAWTTITYQSAGHGDVLMDSESFGSINGSPLGCEAYPDTGYHLTGWTNDRTSDVVTEADLTDTLMTPAAKPDGAWLDTTFTAGFAANGYTVKFALDGGEGTVPTDIKATYDESFSLPDGTGITKTGFELVGWSATAASPTADHALGQEVENLADADGAAVTLHAVWAPAASHVITYAADTGGSVSPTSASVTDGADAAASTATPSAGYHFVEWQDATGAKVSGSATFGPKAVTADATYTATFAEDDPVTITYAATTGGTVSSPSEQVSPVSGTAAGSTATADAGYHFTSWTHVVAQQERVASYDVTLVPAREDGLNVADTYTAGFAGNAYRVAFDANGGDGTMDVEDMTYGTAKPLSVCVFTRTGYTFDGWNTAADGSGMSYADSAQVSDLATEADATVVLYAQWDAGTYTVTFDANSAAATGTMAPQTISYGTATALSACAYSWPGHTLVGWSADASATTATYADGQEVTDLGTATLHAVWAETPEMVVGYVADPEDHCACDPYAELVGGGDDLSADGSEAFPDEGYHFTGWTNDRDATTTADARISSAQVDAVAKVDGTYTDVTFTAHAVANAYTVTFDANGGMGTMADQAMTYGATADLEACAFAKDGATFVGWATNASGPVMYSDGQEVSDLTATDGGTVELHAVWAEQYDESVIVYNAGTGGTVSLEAELVDDGDAAAGSTATADAGYHFVAWVDATGTVVSTSATFLPTEPEDGWADVAYTATFEADTPDTPVSPDTPTSPDAPASTTTAAAASAASVSAVPSTADATVPATPIALVALALLGVALVVRRRRIS